MFARSGTRSRTGDLPGSRARSRRLAACRAKCCDNARTLILHHNPSSRELVLHPRLHAFARHWGFRVRACAPYRARTKGNNDRGVGYVKKNALAGRCFENWAAMEAHLDGWTRKVADGRARGTLHRHGGHRRYRGADGGLRSPGRRLRAAGTVRRRPDGDRAGAVHHRRSADAGADAGLITLLECVLRFGSGSPSETLKRERSRAASWCLGRLQPAAMRERQRVR